MHSTSLAMETKSAMHAFWSRVIEIQCIYNGMLFGNEDGWWTSSPSRTTEDRGREGRLPPSTHAACPLPPLYAGDTLNSCVLLTAPSTGAFDPSSMILPITLSRQKNSKTVSSCECSAACMHSIVWTNVLG